METTALLQLDCVNLANNPLDLSTFIWKRDLGQVDTSKMDL